VGGSSKLREVAKLIVSVKEAILQQSSSITRQHSIIKIVRIDLTAITRDQQYLKRQYSEFEETISSFCSELDILSISPPST
jgi:hypothetical protein